VINAASLLPCMFMYDMLAGRISDSKHRNTHSGEGAALITATHCYYSFNWK